MTRQDKNTLFRREALAKLDDIDELDRVVSVTHPRAWLTLGAVAALLIAALVWSSVGRLSTTVGGDGILLAGGHTLRVTTTEGGRLEQIAVGLGDRVSQGQAVATLMPPPSTPANEHAVPVLSPYDGVVVSMQAYRGEYLAAGAPIVTVEPDAEPLQATLYLPVDVGKKVRLGQEAQIIPDTVSIDEYGFMRARVTFVADLPSTPESMQSVLQNDFLVQKFAAAGPVIRIEATLVREPSNPSGYAWSTSCGPDMRVSTGTTCSARIVLSSSAPLTYAFPALKRYLGGAD